MNNPDRYDRQQRIEGWHQEALRQSRVFVAGAGALGNEVIKNLAMTGIGHILVVDSDHIELSNLSRTVFFTNADINRAKAPAIVKAASKLNPDVKLRYINGDLFFDVGLGFYRHTDLVIGCLDSIAARSRVGLSCFLAGVPFLDGGTWALGGEVRWFVPGRGPCFECTLTEKDRESAARRISCTGFSRSEAGFPIPSTISISSVIGGILAQEAVKYLCGWKIEPGQAIVYNGLNLSMHRAELPINPSCKCPKPYENIKEIDAGVSEWTGRDLLKRAEQDVGKNPILELGRDFLLKLQCSACTEKEQVNRPLGQVDADRLQCPACKRERESLIISRLQIKDKEGERKLSDLGVPPGEVLGVRSGETVGLYELFRDVEKLWK